MDSGESNLELETALRNREFEIQLFWQRTNYFLVLLTALGVGVFTIEDQLIGVVISLFAAITCFLWFETNLGSRFWQVFWEVEVVRLSKIHGISAFLQSTETIKAALKERQAEETSRSLFRKLIDDRMLRKPSVTFNMIVLSLFALILWIGIFLYFSYDLIFPETN